MTALEIALAGGGCIAVVAFLTQALRRDKEPDGYVRRGSLMGMIRKAPAPTDKKGRPVAPPTSPGLVALQARRRAALDRAERHRFDAARDPAGRVLTPVEPEGTLPPLRD